MIKHPSRFEVITLFVDDIADARRFYKDVLDPKVVYEDDVSSVLKFGELVINLLQVTEAPVLVEPLMVATPRNGVAVLLTIKVEDVDSTCAELTRRGVSLLNGPVDRPWGRRTAAFADPSGHVWEIAQELPTA
ncbi:MAG: glyoxalase [Methylocystaceae bacterium]|nr:MAG: glyoxalase [Methylocystaceae bacterium]